MRPEVARRRKFLRIFYFFGKATPYGKIFKILFRKFSSRHRSTCCVPISWNLADRKSVKLCVAYPTKKNKSLHRSHALATARIAPKICQGQPQVIYSEYSEFHPNRFTFSGVIAERVNTVETRRKVNPIFGWSLAWSRITKKLISKIQYQRLILGLRATYYCTTVKPMWTLLKQ